MEGKKHRKRGSKPPPRGHVVSKAKAKKILEDGSVRGHKLTKKQKGLFGAIAGGNSYKR